MIKPPVTRVHCTHLAAEDGLSIRLLNRGASLQSIRVPTPGGTVEALLGYPGTEE